MSATPNPSHADDLVRLIEILGAAPDGGVSLEEIQQATEAGEPWSLRTVNALLCDLGRGVGHEKVRGVRGKVTKYWLKAGN